MAATEFFRDIVEPTVADFIQRPFDVRLGHLSAIVLYHMADHFALDTFVGNERRAMDKEIISVREKIVNRCPEFRLVGDVADAAKHFKLSTPKKVIRQLSSYEQTDAPHGLFEAPFGESYFAEAITVVATLDDGTTKELLPAVLAVLETWKAVLDDVPGNADHDCRFRNAEL